MALLSIEALVVKLIYPFKDVFKTTFIYFWIHLGTDLARTKIKDSSKMLYSNHFNFNFFIRNHLWKYLPLLFESVLKKVWQWMIDFWRSNSSLIRIKNRILRISDHYEKQSGSIATAFDIPIIVVFTFRELILPRINFGKFSSFYI